MKAVTLVALTCLFGAAVFLPAAFAAQGRCSFGDKERRKGRMTIGDGALTAEDRKAFERLEQTPLKWNDDGGYWQTRGLEGWEQASPPVVVMAKDEFCRRPKAVAQAQPDKETVERAAQLDSYLSTVTNAGDLDAKTLAAYEQVMASDIEEKTKQGLEQKLKTALGELGIDKQQAVQAAKRRIESRVEAGAAPSAGDSEFLQRYFGYSREGVAALGEKAAKVTEAQAAKGQETADKTSAGMQATAQQLGVGQPGAAAAVPAAQQRAATMGSFRRAPTEANLQNVRNYANQPGQTQENIQISQETARQAARDVARDLQSRYSGNCQNYMLSSMPQDCKDMAAQQTACVNYDASRCADHLQNPSQTCRKYEAACFK